MESTCREGEDGTRIAAGGGSTYVGAAQKGEDGTGMTRGVQYT